MTYLWVRQARLSLPVGLLALRSIRGDVPLTIHRTAPSFNLVSCRAFQANYVELEARLGGAFRLPRMDCTVLRGACVEMGQDSVAFRHSFSLQPTFHAYNISLFPVNISVSAGVVELNVSQPCRLLYRPEQERFVVQTPESGYTNTSLQALCIFALFRNNSEEAARTCSYRHNTERKGSILLPGREPGLFYFATRYPVGVAVQCGRSKIAFSKLVAGRGILRLRDPTCNLLLGKNLVLSDLVCSFLS